MFVWVLVISIPGILSFSTALKYHNPLRMEEIIPLIPFLDDKSTLSYQCLLNLSPQMHGQCMINKNSIYSFFFPCCFQTWKPRFILLLGNFLYRFENENDKFPKGLPIKINNIQIKIISTTEFRIISLRKEYQLKFETPDLCNLWLSFLKERQYLSIKEEMGHIEIDPKIKKINEATNKLILLKLSKEREEPIVIDREKYL